MARLNVNGSMVDIDVDGTTPLLWVLREQLGLTGTKYGCGIAQCGACTVHIGGVAQRSCVRPVNSLSENDEITTIEGLSPVGRTRRAAVRLLPVGANYGRRRIAGAKPNPDGCRYRRSNDQHMPLWNLAPSAQRYPPRRRA